MLTRKNGNFLIMILVSFTFTIILSLTLQIHFVYGLEMDIKCAVYENSDDENGDNVDVRILAIGLNGNSDYTAEVIPDHNFPTSVTSKTDYEGIFWAVAKIPNGDKSLLFNVNLYEGKDINGALVASGNDDTPCYPISLFDN
jgi:hypothetical protein